MTDEDLLAEFDELNGSQSDKEVSDDDLLAEFDAISAENTASSSGQNVPEAYSPENEKQAIRSSIEENKDDLDSVLDSYGKINKIDAQNAAYYSLNDGDTVRAKNGDTFRFSAEKAANGEDPRIPISNAEYASEHGEGPRKDWRVTADVTEDDLKKWKKEDEDKKNRIKIGEDAADLLEKRFGKITGKHAIGAEFAPADDADELDDETSEIAKRVEKFEGNTLNHKNRPMHMMYDADGKIEGYGTTNSTIVEELDGTWSVIPTIRGGQGYTEQMADDEAREWYRHTQEGGKEGDRWGNFKTEEEAKAAAEDIHKLHAATYSRKWNQYINEHWDEMSDSVKNADGVSEYHDKWVKAGSPTGMFDVEEERAGREAANKDAEPKKERTFSEDIVNSLVAETGDDSVTVGRAVGAYMLPFMMLKEKGDANAEIDEAEALLRSSDRSERRDGYERLKAISQAKDNANEVLGSTYLPWYKTIGAGAVKNTGYTLNYAIGAALAVPLTGAMSGAGVASKIAKGAVELALPMATATSERYGDLSRNAYGIDEEGNLSIDELADPTTVAGAKAVIGGVAEAVVEKYLEKAMAPLARNGLVRAVRGKVMRKVAERPWLANIVRGYGKMARFTAMNGAPMEILEEDAQAFIDDVLQVSKRGDAMTDLDTAWRNSDTLSAKGQLDVFMNMIGTMAFQGVLGGVTQHYANKGANKRVKEYVSSFDDIQGIDPEWSKRLSDREKVSFLNLYNKFSANPEKLREAADRMYGTNGALDVLLRKMADRKNVEMSRTLQERGIEPERFTPKTGSNDMIVFENKKVRDPKTGEETVANVAFDEAHGVLIYDLGENARGYRYVVASVEGTKAAGFDNLNSAGYFADTIVTAQQVRDSDNEVKLGFLNDMVVAENAKRSDAAAKHNTVPELLRVVPHANKRSFMGVFAGSDNAMKSAGDAWDRGAPIVKIGDTLHVLLDNMTSPAVMEKAMAKAVSTGYRGSNVGGMKSASTGSNVQVIDAEVEKPAEHSVKPETTDAEPPPMVDIGEMVVESARQMMANVDDASKAKDFIQQMEALTQRNPEQAEAFDAMIAEVAGKFPDKSEAKPSRTETEQVQSEQKEEKTDTSYFPTLDTATAVETEESVSDGSTVLTKRGMGEVIARIADDYFKDGMSQSSSIEKAKEKVRFLLSAGSLAWGQELLGRLHVANEGRLWFTNEYYKIHPEALEKSLREHVELAKKELDEWKALGRNTESKEKDLERAEKRLNEFLEKKDWKSVQTKQTPSAVDAKSENAESEEKPVEAESEDDILDLFKVETEADDIDSLKSRLKKLNKLVRYASSGTRKQKAAVQNQIGEGKLFPSFSAITDEIASVKQKIGDYYRAKKAEESKKYKAISDAKKSAVDMPELAKFIKSARGRNGHENISSRNVQPLLDWLADPKHNNLTLKEAVDIVEKAVNNKKVIKADGTLDKVNDALASAKARLVKLQDAQKIGNIAKAKAAERAKVSDKQIDSYIDSGRGGLAFKMWAHGGGSILKEPSVYGKGHAKEGQYVAGSEGAEELNAVLNGRSAEDRKEIREILFGKDSEPTRTGEVTGNDGRVSELFNSATGGATEDAVAGENGNPYENNYGKLIEDTLKAVRDFREWKENGAKDAQAEYYAQQEEAEKANTVELGGEPYHLDDLEVGSMAEEAYNEAKGIVAKFSQESPEVQLFSKQSLSKCESGDVIYFDHQDDVTFLVDSFDPKTGELVLTDEATFGTKKYVVTEDTIQEIKETENGQEDRQGADDDVARNEEGGGDEGFGDDLPTPDIEAEKPAVRRDRPRLAKRGMRGDLKSSSAKRYADIVTPDPKSPDYRNQVALIRDGFKVSAVDPSIVKKDDGTPIPASSLRIENETDAAILFQNFFYDPTVESAKVIFLDKDGNVIPAKNGIAIQKIGFGKVGSAGWNADEVIELIPDGCAKVIISHNHPSGITKPSKEDVTSTRSLKNLVARKKPSVVVDHIITDTDRFYAFNKGEEIRAVTVENDGANLVKPDSRVVASPENISKVIAPLLSPEVPNTSYIVGIGGGLTVDGGNRILHVAMLPSDSKGIADLIENGMPGSRMFAIGVGANGFPEVETLLSALDKRGTRKTTLDDGTTVDVPDAHVKYVYKNGKLDVFTASERAKAVEKIKETPVAKASPVEAKNGVSNVSGENKLQRAGQPHDGIVNGTDVNIINDEKIGSHATIDGVDVKFYWSSSSGYEVGFGNMYNWHRGFANLTEAAKFAKDYVSKNKDYIELPPDIRREYSNLADVGIEPRTPTSTLEKVLEGLAGKESDPFYKGRIDSIKKILASRKSNDASVNPNAVKKGTFKDGIKANDSRITATKEDIAEYDSIAEKIGASESSEVLGDLKSSLGKGEVADRNFLAEALYEQISILEDSLANDEIEHPKYDALMKRKRGGARVSQSELDKALKEDEKDFKRELASYRRLVDSYANKPAEKIPVSNVEQNVERSKPVAKPVSRIPDNETPAQAERRLAFDKIADTKGYSFTRSGPMVWMHGYDKKNNVVVGQKTARNGKSYDVRLYQSLGWEYGAKKVRGEWVGPQAYGIPYDQIPKGSNLLDMIDESEGATERALGEAEAKRKEILGRTAEEKQAAREAEAQQVRETRWEAEKQSEDELKKQADELFGDSGIDWDNITAEPTEETWPVPEDAFAPGQLRRSAASSEGSSQPAVTLPNTPAVLNGTANIVTVPVGKVKHGISQYRNGDRTVRTSDIATTLRDLSKVFGGMRYAGRSRYATYECKIGNVTLRLSDHNASGENFAKDGSGNYVSVWIEGDQYEHKDSEIPYVEIKYPREVFEARPSDVIKSIVDGVDGLLDTGVYSVDPALGEKTEFGTASSGFAEPTEDSAPRRMSQLDKVYNVLTNHAKFAIREGKVSTFEEFKDFIGKAFGSNAEKVARFLPSVYNSVRLDVSPEIRERMTPEVTVNRMANEASGIPDRGKDRIGHRVPTVTMEYLMPKPTERVTADTFHGGIDADQVKGVNLALDAINKPNGSFMLADGAGFGKTRQILSIAEMFRRENPGAKILILSENKDLLENEYVRDAKALGIDIGGFVRGTYNGLANLDFHPNADEPDMFGYGNWDLVMLDEAHNLANSGSQRAQAFMSLPAKHVVFATATPMDRFTDAAYFLARLNECSPEAIARTLGYALVEREFTKRKDGKDIVEKRLSAEELPGQDIDSIKLRLIEERDKAIAAGKMVRRAYPFLGKIEKRGYEMDKVHGQNELAIVEYYQDTIKKTKTAKKIYLKGTTYYKGGLPRGVPSNRFNVGVTGDDAWSSIVHRKVKELQDEMYRSVDVINEHYKANAAADLAKEIVGKDPNARVIIVGQQVGVHKIEGGFLDQDTGTPQINVTGFERTVESLRGGKAKVKFLIPPSLGVVDESLRKVGITDIAHIDGNHKRAVERDEFVSHRKPILVMTDESGGTGINLDDTTGAHPTHMIILVQNYSAKKIEQLVNRISRKNTASTPHIYLLVNDSFADAHRNSVTDRKVGVLQAIQGGADADANLEIDMEEPTEEYSQEDVEARESADMIFAEPTEEAIGDIKHAMVEAGIFPIGKLRGLSNKRLAEKVANESDPDHNGAIELLYRRSMGIEGSFDKGTLPSFIENVMHVKPEFVGDVCANTWRAVIDSLKKESTRKIWSEQSPESIVKRVGRWEAEDFVRTMMRREDKETLVLDKPTERKNGTKGGALVDSVDNRVKISYLLGEDERFKKNRLRNRRILGIVLSRIGDEKANFLQDIISAMTDAEGIRMSADRWSDRTVVNGKIDIFTPEVTKALSSRYPSIPVGQLVGRAKELMKNIDAALGDWFFGRAFDVEPTDTAFGLHDGFDRDYERSTMGIVNALELEGDHLYADMLMLAEDGLTDTAIANELQEYYPERIIDQGLVTQYIKRLKEKYNWIDPRRGLSLFDGWTEDRLAEQGKRAKSAQKKAREAKLETLRNISSNKQTKIAKTSAVEANFLDKMFDVEPQTDSTESSAGGESQSAETVGEVAMMDSLAKKYNSDISKMRTALLAKGLSREAADKKIDRWIERSRPNPTDPDGNGGPKSLVRGGQYEFLFNEPTEESSVSNNATEDEYTQQTVLAVDNWRASHKMNPLRNYEKMTYEDMRKHVDRELTNRRNFEENIKRMIENPNYALTPEEVAELTHRMEEVEREYNTKWLERNAAEASGNQGLAEKIQRELYAMQPLIDRIQQANRKFRNIWGKAGRAMQIAIGKDYSFTRIVSDCEKAKGAPLSDEERAIVDTLVKRLRGKQIELDRKKISDMDALFDSLIKDWLKDAHSAIQNKLLSDKSKEEITRLYNNALLQLQFHGKKHGGLFMAVPNARKYLNAIQRYHLAQHDIYNEDGTPNEKMALQAIIRDLDSVGVTANEWQIRQALTDMGVSTVPPKTQLERDRRELNSQHLLEQQIAYIEKFDELPPVTGYQRDTPSAVLREMRKRRAALIKEKGLDAEKEEGRLKSALESAKTRIRNRIEEINLAIKNNEAIPKERRESRTDEELIQLKADYKAAKQAYDEAFPKSEQQKYDERVLRAMNTLKRQLKDWDEKYARAQGLDFSSEAKPEELRDPRIMALRANLEARKQAWQALHDAFFPDGTAEELKKQVESRMKALDDRLDAIQLKIKEFENADTYEKKVAALSGKQKKDPLRTPEIAVKEAEIEREKAKIEEFKRQLKDMEKTAFRKGLEKIGDATSFARLLRTSMDISAVLTQGGVMSLRHPAEAAKGVLRAVKSIDSTKADEINGYLRSDPWFKDFIEMGGHVYGGIDKPEAFRGVDRSIIAKIPGINHAVSASERAFTTYLNSFALSMYKEMVSSGFGVGGPTEDQRRALAAFVNHALGYGYSSNGNNAGNALIDATMFAPRLVVGSMKMAFATDVWAAPLFTGNKNTYTGGQRAQVAWKIGKEWVGAMAAGIAVQALLKMLWDDEEDKDGEDWLEFFFGVGNTREFMRPSRGNSHWMIGMSKVVRWWNLVGKMCSAERDENGKVAYGKGFGDMLQREIRKVLSPVAATMWDWYDGTDILGRPINWGKFGLSDVSQDRPEISGTFHVLENMLVPLFVADLASSYRHGGIGTAVTEAPLLALGAQVQHYRKPDAFDKAVQQGKDYRKEMRAAEESEDDETAEYLERRYDKVIGLDENGNEVTRGDVVDDATSIQKDIDKLNKEIAELEKEADRTRMFIGQTSEGSAVRAKYEEILKRNLSDINDAKADLEKLSDERAGLLRIAKKTKWHGVGKWGE